MATQKFAQECVVCGHKKYHGDFWSKPDGSCSRFVCAMCLLTLGVMTGSRSRKQAKGEKKGAPKKAARRTVKKKARKMVDMEAGVTNEGET